MLIIIQNINLNVIESCVINQFTFGSEANTCCLTSQTSRSDGNCKLLNTFNSGTCTRTRSHPSRGSGGGSSSKPSPPAKIGAWSMLQFVLFFSKLFDSTIICCVISAHFRYFAYGNMPSTLFITLFTPSKSPFVFSLTLFNE